MEYSKTYEITRLMHARPCAEVTGMANRLHNKYKGLEIYLQNPKSEEIFECRSILGLMICVSENFLIGSKVNIITKGEYEKKVLEECNRALGNLFLSKD